MSSATIHDNVLTRFSSFVEERLGLCFPPPRWVELERGLRLVSSEFGFADAAKCADWILTTKLTPKQLELLASHLTIGETYFFRDPSAFNALEHTILPELIRTRGRDTRALRFWSAGCCTGEEAYSIAMVLDRFLLKHPGWKVFILATDINPHFLQKACVGNYTSWSFRGMDEGTKKRYFVERVPGTFALISRVKEMVSFQPLNLVDDVYPSLATDTNAMDVIFCRNVLMYFSRPQARRAVVKLSECLVPGACLFTSAAEASSELFAPLKAGDFPGTVAYRKLVDQTIPEPSLPVIKPYPPRMARPEKLATKEKASPLPATLPHFPETARTLANQGRLKEALMVCDEAITLDKLDAKSHYLRGTILQEEGDFEEAINSLRRALFLDPDFVLAHFAMATLLARRTRAAEAARHLERTRTLLCQHDGDAVLPESDGLTARRLLAMLDTMQEVHA